MSSSCSNPLSLTSPNRFPCTHSQRSCSEPVQLHSARKFLHSRAAENLPSARRNSRNLVLLFVAHDGSTLQFVCALSPEYLRRRRHISCMLNLSNCADIVLPLCVVGESGGFSLPPGSENSLSQLLRSPVHLSDTFAASLRHLCRLSLPHKLRYHTATLHTMIPAGFLTMPACTCSDDQASEW